MQYLKRVAGFSGPLFTKVSPGGAQQLNPSLPRPPAGTEVALVRQMMLANSHGELVPTHLIESVELRVYRTLPDAPSTYIELQSQDAFDFNLKRSKLFAGEAGGIESIAGPTLSTFMTHGVDPFEWPGTQMDTFGQQPFSMRQCIGCHVSNLGPGGVQSLVSFDYPSGELTKVHESAPDKESGIMVHYKKMQPNWSALRSEWRNTNDAIH